jgi:hypothetical protein
MPKRITVYLIVIITLTSLLMVLGCGSGDKGAVSRLNASEVNSGGTDTTWGGTDVGTGGVGGSATGACVITGGCYQGIDQTSCGYLSGAFHAGQTCAANGFANCSTYGGYTVCM